MTSDEETMVSQPLNNRAVESCEDVEEVEITKDSCQDETVKELFEVDFAWMSNFFKDMS